MTTARRPPMTLWIGLAFMLLLEGLLFYHVHITGRSPAHSDEQIITILRKPVATFLEDLARQVAINMTALVWVGYLVFLEGVLTWQQGRSPIRQRPHHFAMLFLASVTIWCVFDWINFYYIHAWNYIGMPPLNLATLTAYVLAFGTIVPGMLMTGQVLMNLGLFNWARTHRQLPLFSNPALLITSAIVGLAMFLWPILYHDPITNLTLWTSLVFLLDPINFALGRPSMFRDWTAGRFDRTLAAFAGGLGCGFLWEFWNYWALAKWTYHLPFLGTTEPYKYFEMPLVGLIGFIPFGIECWIMWQLMRIPLDGLVEELPTDKDLL